MLAIRFRRAQKPPIARRDGGFHMATQRDVDRLRYDAWLAYLDNRNARAKDLNKRADKLAADLRKVA